MSIYAFKCDEVNCKGLYYKKSNKVNEKTSSDTREKFGHSYKEEVRMGMLDSVYHLT